MSFEISLFKPNADATQTRNVDFTNKYETFRELALAISTDRPWSPGIFQNGIRNNAGLSSISLLVLDFDSGMALKEATEAFKDYKHIIGTSKSHSIEKGGVICDRFRVVLALDKPCVNDSEFKAVWFAAFAKWPAADRACKDAARFFFPCKTIVSVNENGLLWSERAVAKQPATKQLATSNKQRGSLSKATKAFLIDGAPDGEWHSRMFKAVTDLKEQEYSLEEILTKCEAITGELDSHDLQLINDIWENRAPKYEPRVLASIDNWPVYIVDSKGRVTDRPSGQAPQNYRYLIHKLGYKFEYNEMDGQIYFNGKEWEESDFLSLWVTGKDVGLHGSKDLSYATVDGLARDHSYNPVKRLIESVAWDGKDHIEQLFGTISLRQDEDLNLLKKYLKKWLVGVVVKLYDPGQQNLVLTFVGGQGIGKSKWLTKLAMWPKAYGEGAIDPTDKDHELRHLTHLIWHIPELDSTTGKRESGFLKDYLTRDFVTVRPAYARLTRQGRSICSFAASVNADEFLVDPTGNRRFLCVPVEDINYQHSVDIQQVFAQARALMLSGYPHWLDKAEIKELNLHNERFEMQDVLTALAQTVQPGPDSMTVIELLSALDYVNPSRADIARFAAVLKRNGIHRVRENLAGVRRRVVMVKNPKGSKELRLPKPV